MKKLIIASLVLSIFASNYVLAKSDTLPKWTKISAAYTYSEFEPDRSFQGFSLAGSAHIEYGYFANFKYEQTSNSKKHYFPALDNAEIETDTRLINSSLGFGKKINIYKNTDIFSVISYEKIELKIDNLFEGETATIEKMQDGYGIQFGIKSNPFEILEVESSIKHIEIRDEKELLFQGIITYNIDNEYSIGIEYTKGKEHKKASLVANYYF